MPSTRDIRRRIKSVQSTKKITKAMELVATSKMKKAIAAVLATRPYANLSWATVLHLSENLKEDLHPLLKARYTRDTKKIGIVLIASNRGLCGGFNSQIIAKAIDFIKSKNQENLNAEMFLLGKKSQEIAYKHNQPVVAEFEKLDYVNTAEEVRPLAKMIIGDFLDKKYDKIFVIYTDFISTIKQEARIKRLLPIKLESKDKYLGIVGADTRLGLDEKFVKDKEAKYLKTDGYTYEYKFEPNPREILDEMLPRLIEIQLYQALLESNASEHSARMMAMRNATEASEDMIYDLSLVYNKTRQAGITREIAEISAGAGAIND
ncbi:MAG: ATP synthase gamma chain [Parcubacteria group bacterium GW2011_GWC2_42_6]|nr:MAG: ATP synthase gamma chain [Parcubacteria group bacterium GW2011_GWC2_42_6]